MVTGQQETDRQTDRNTDRQTDRETGNTWTRQGIEFQSQEASVSLLYSHSQNKIKEAAVVFEEHV